MSPKTRASLKENMTSNQREILSDMGERANWPMPFGLGGRARNKIHGYVLVIEDDADFAELLKNALEFQPGIHVTVAADARAAGEHLTARHFDLVIADWSLPASSSINAIRKADRMLQRDAVAALGEFDFRPVPILMVSADPHLLDTTDQEDCENFKFVVFLQKQLGVRTIVRKAVKLLNHRHSTPVTRLD
jgi:CheY-like chemotaxis protein